MSFSIGQVSAFLMAGVGLILTILNIYDKLTAIRKNADAPFRDLQQRVVVLEAKAQEHESRLLHGNDQFRNQAEFNKMFMQVQLAFVDFEVAFCQDTQYTNTANLLKAKSALQDALTSMSTR